MGGTQDSQHLMTSASGSFGVFGSMGVSVGVFESERASGSVGVSGSVEMFVSMGAFGYVGGYAWGCLGPQAGSLGLLNLRSFLEGFLNGQTGLFSSSSGS